MLGCGEYKHEQDRKNFCFHEAYILIESWECSEKELNKQIRKVDSNKIYLVNKNGLV